MEDSNWSEHLNHWQLFLEERLRLTTDESGEQTKIKRQIRAINAVRFGAVLNPTALLSFIQPDAQKLDYPILDWNLNLNSSQKIAVKASLSGNDLTLIQGPPGTGKTQVIAETCLQLYQSNSSIRILVCSETHIAVNNVLDRVGKLNDEMRIVRIQDKEESLSIINYSSESILENYSAWVDDNVTNETISQILRESFINSKDKRGTEKALFLSSNLVGMTCNRVGAYNLINSNELFDVVIIDEVCKATLPEILMPLSISKKAILVGDPKQLPPVFSTEERSVIESIENSNLQDYMYINELFEGDNGAVLLDTQYRMSSQIGKLIGDLFYSGKLIDGRKEEILNAVNWIDYKPTKKWPLDVEIKSDNPKIFNLDECKIILQLVNLLSKLDNVGSIAIIAPYRAQVNKLRTILKNVDLNINVDTVDGFQGKESDVVIFSLTRNHGTFRFLSDERRLNVALSRAKNKIFIVGDVRYSSKNKLLSSIIQRSEVITFEVKN
ncbi:TPA: DEAD/DEAH box helicase [Streptococcus suis]